MNGTMSQLTPRNVNIFLKPLSFNINPQTSFSMMLCIVLRPIVCLLQIPWLLPFLFQCFVFKFVLCTPIYLYSRAMKNTARDTRITSLCDTFYLTGLFKDPSESNSNSVVLLQKSLHRLTIILYFRFIWVSSSNITLKFLTFLEFTMMKGNCGVTLVFYGCLFLHLFSLFSFPLMDIAWVIVHNFV